MTNVLKACEVILNILKDWEACAIDLEGLLGGLIAIWNPMICKLSPFKTRVGIWL